MNCDIYQGDALNRLKELPDTCVQCCVTSPPYWGLRDYGVEGQMGLESTPKQYVEKMVNLFREVRRVMRDDGTLWLNLGDSYAGSGKARGGGGDGSTSAKQVTNRGAYFDGGVPVCVPNCKAKDLIGTPWMVAFALRDDGWYLRSDIIWAKPNPMPESVTDRPTRSHEYIFLFSKQPRYYYDHEAIKEKAVTEPHAAGYKNGHEYATGPMNRNGHSQREGDQSRVWGGKNEKSSNRTYDGFNARWDDKENNGDTGATRNKRTVWMVNPVPYSDAHFATFPPDLIKPCILAGTKPGDTVLDPFGGSGTTGMVALELGRKAILIELNPDYCELIQQRTNVTPGLALA